MNNLNYEIEQVFLHFFDIHFLELRGINNSARRLRDQIEFECRLATRFAILASKKVLVPAASFFESEICNKILVELNDLYSTGNIFLVGGGMSIDEYIDEKLSQYSINSDQFIRYRQMQKNKYFHPPYQSRRHSASKDITTGWLNILESDNINKLTLGSNLVLPKDIEKKWLKIPERLGKNAFIVDYVEPLLFSREQPITIRNRLNGIINEQYFGSYTREYCCGIVSELVYLASPHPIPSYSYDIPYKTLLDDFRRSNLLKKIQILSGKELINLKSKLETTTCIANALNNKIVNHQVNLEMSTISNDELNSATIGIITALPEEFAAVCEVFQCNSTINAPGTGSGRKYSIGIITTNTGIKHKVAVTLLSDMGNNSAAIRAANMKLHCKNIQHIIMTGIAGAVPNPEKPDEHVRLGDIVVSNRGGVIQYDFIKESSTEKIEYRNPPRPPSSLLIEADKYLIADSLRGVEIWHNYIDAAISKLGDDWVRPNDDFDILMDHLKENKIHHPNDKTRFQGKPKVYHGPIASANTLLKNPIKRDLIRDSFGIKAIEMEGSGIADASWSSEIGYFVVRGTCDYCDSNKNDDWHKYASVVAAAYTRALLENIS